MAKPREQDRVKRDMERIRTADKVYERWEKQYECKRLSDYYAGRQWYGYPEPKEDDPRTRPYTINLIFPTIETQQPSLLFYRPTVKIEPRPPYADNAQSDIAERATLCENTVQTFINDERRVHFKLQTLLSLRDAWFRFGMVEVGYTSDWIDNPHAGKPVLKEDDTPVMDSDTGQPVLQPDKVVKKGSEQLFIKRVRPNDVRVSVSGKNVLDENDWVGYWEWVYVEDVKRNPEYSNTSTLKASGVLADAQSDTKDPDQQKRAGMVRIFKLWDLRRKVKRVLADGHDKYLIEDKPWTFLPLSALKFYELSDSWYPLPAVSQWISPQDEINETREMQRVHRRRFYRRYTYMTGAIDATELEKLENGGDGVYAKRNSQEDSIAAVQDAPLSGDWNVLAASKDDFQQITGVTGDQRGAPEAQTATQANIASVTSQVRQSSMRLLVGDWLADIARIMLLTIREKMQLPFWIKLNVDPLNPDPQAVLATAQAWKEITAKDLGEDALDVSVDVTSLSPVSMDAERQMWTTGVLPMITNPALALTLSASDVLLRKTLKYYNITAAQDIAEIKKALTVVVAAMAGQMQQQAPGAAAPAAMPTLAAGMPAAMAGPIQ